MIDIDTSSRSEQRKFGLVMAAAIAALGFLRSAWHHGLWQIAMPWGFLAVAGAFAALGIAAPGVLRPVLVWWIRFAEALNWLITRILLTLVFVLVISPMGLWFRLARTSVIAGSLVPDIGGHNPLEAARLDCPAISGPFVENWASAYAGLEAVAGVVMTAPSDLAKAIAADLTDPDAARARAARARDFVDLRDREARAGLSRILELAP